MEGMEDLPDRTETAKKVQFKTQSNLKEVFAQEFDISSNGNPNSLEGPNAQQESHETKKSSDDLVQASAQP